MAVFTELMVCSNRFCRAPSEARCVETALISVWTVVLSVMTAPVTSKFASAAAPSTTIVSAVS